MEKIIEPSLLALDKDRASELLTKIKDLKLKYVHYDVMDDEFIGHGALTGQYLDILEKLKIYPNVHLMVQHPEDYIKLFKDLKVNSITFHVETQDIAKAKKLLQSIHDLGFKAGISVKMETNLLEYVELAPYCEFILVMSVNPGLGGQKYSDACQINLQAAKIMKNTNPNIRVQLDGGVNDEIIKKNYDLVDNFITGSWFFKNIDQMPKYIKLLQEFKN